MHRSFTPVRAVAIAAPRPTPATRLVLWAALFTLAFLAVSFSSAQAATYYVATGGSNSNPGTMASPWSTLSSKLPSLRGGDVVIYRNGTYTDSLDLANIPLTADGTVVTIKAETPRGVTLKGGGAFFTIGSSQHVPGGVKIEGLKITDGQMNVGFNSTGDNIEINNCEIWGAIEGFRLRGGKNLRLIDNYLHDNNQGFLMGTKSVSGIAGITIERCIAANNSYSGQTGNTDGFVIEGYSSNVVIRDCISYGAGDAGFDLKPDNTLIERCISYNNTGMGIKLWGTGSKVVNCIVYGNNAEGIGTAGSNLLIAGNTIANNGQYGIRFENTNSSTLTMRNNIIYNNPIWSYGSMPNDDYNCYYASSGYVIRTASTTYSMSQVDAHSVPVGAHTMGRDPRMTNPGSANFALATGSPCIDAGVANSAMTLDYYGKTRGNPPDIGAIETNATATPSAPTAPTSVTVSPSGSVGTDQDLTATATGSTATTGTVTYSYEWSVSLNGGSTWGAWGGYSGRTLVKSNLAEGQMWKARARATTDNTNYSAWTESAAVTVGTVVAQPDPSVLPPHTVTINPAAPVDTDDLQAAARGGGNGDASYLYQFEWARSTDGATWSAWGWQKSRITAAETAAGETWKTRCRVYNPANPNTFSVWAESAPVTIEGATTPPPAVPTAPTAVGISPGPTVGTDQDLRVEATGCTISTGGTITYRYQWAVSTNAGSTWSAWGYDGNVLLKSNLADGQMWKARACGTADGATFGPWTESSRVTVSNPTTPPPTGSTVTAPTAVGIFPGPVVGTDKDLRVEARGSTSTAGTRVTYRYQWSVSTNGGSTWGPWGVNSNRLPKSNLAAGQMWRAQAQATDGVSTSAWVIAKPVTVVDNSTAIKPTSVTISPATPKAGDLLTAVVQPAASPGVTYRYEWRVAWDGTTWTSWAAYFSAPTVNGKFISNGMALQVRVRATTGSTVSDWVVSQIVTVGASGGGGTTTANVAPTTPTSAWITPDPARDPDTLAGNASGSTDANGDTIAYQFRWHYSLDGGATWNLYQTRTTLDAGLTGVNNLWKVEARAYDGALYSGWKMSDPVLIRR